MDTTESKPDFKKPVLIGKRGKLPKALAVKKPDEVASEDESESISNAQTEGEILSAAVSEEKKPVQTSEEPAPLPYKEPDWSGLPGTSDVDYSFQVLKAGSIIEKVDLMKKPYWVFGRLTKCDIYMAHPTISRYHAVLQYRQEATDTEPQGFYLYDLGSTHGTFLNKNRLRSRVYVRVQVGHMIKLGGSSRTFILTGPEKDMEAASELSVTELKQQRADELLKREQAEREAKEKARLEAEELKRKEEERGVDWGMGEDADEESDLIENPYAQTNNEELYLDDPKKALRGFMEREGIDFEYDCSEQGIGQFVCKVELPVDDDRGRPIVAEAVHKGKKKEAVLQCALEACRILDRLGLLRQATHESRKRKAKNWEENDFYDSDDDTFLDRTGTIEKKRENRMKAKLPQQAETYQSLVQKEKAISSHITEINQQLNARICKYKVIGKSEDSLDSYMRELRQPALDRDKAVKLRAELAKLKKEHANVIKLVNLARPADLPPLVPQYNSNGQGVKGKLPIFGKRLKVKVQRPVVAQEVVQEDSDDDDVDKLAEFQKATKRFESPEVFKLIWDDVKVMHEDKINSVVTYFADLTVINREELSKLLETSETKLEHLIKQLERVLTKNSASQTSVNQEDADISTGDNKIDNTENVKFVIKSKPKIKIANSDDISESTSKCAREVETDAFMDAEDQMSEERKRKRNQRRIQQRQEKNEQDRLRGYVEDSMKEDYNMWVPPAGQTGDGKTSLNDKFGY